MMNQETKEILAQINKNFFCNGFRLPEADQTNAELNQKLYAAFKKANPGACLLKLASADQIELVRAEGKERLHSFEVDWLIGDDEVAKIEELITEAKKGNDDQRKQAVWLIERLYEEKIGVQLMWS